MPAHPQAFFNSCTLTVPQSLIGQLYDDRKELLEKYLALDLDDYANEPSTVLMTVFQSFPVL